MVDGRGTHPVSCMHQRHDAYKFCQVQRAPTERVVVDLAVNLMDEALPETFIISGSRPWDDVSYILGIADNLRLKDFTL